MYRKIIAAYQPGEHGRETLALACALAEPASANVIVVTVLDTRGYWGADHSLIDRLEHEARSKIEEGIRAWPMNVRASVRVLRGRSAAGALHALAEDERADLLVLGSSRLGRVAKTLVGTTAEHVLYGAPCPVALAPRGYQRPLAGLRSIGVAFDGSAQSRVALVWAAGAAAQIGSPLRVIAVVVPDAPPDMREALSAAVADLPYDLPVELETPSGDPTLELRAAAGRGMDLLVAGSRGYGPFRGVLAGSVSAALARNCAAPVVVVPRAGRARADGTRSFATGEHELSPDEVAEMISASRMQVVDVRDAGELAAGALPGAHHIPVADLAADATTLSRELPVVFCSGTGERAALAMHACRALGMTAYSMRGGIDAWIKRGLPIESPAARPHTAPRAPGTAPAGRRPPRRSPAARA